MVALFFLIKCGVDLERKRSKVPTTTKIKSTPNLDKKCVIDLKKYTHESGSGYLDIGLEKVVP